MIFRNFRSSQIFSFVMTIAVLAGCSDNGETYQFRKPGTNVYGMWRTEDAKCSDTGYNTIGKLYKFKENAMILGNGFSPQDTQGTGIRVYESPKFGNLVLLNPYGEITDPLYVKITDPQYYEMVGPFIALQDHGDYLEEVGKFFRNSPGTDGETIMKKSEDATYRLYFCP